MNDVVYIDKNGKRSKKPPRGIPPFIPKNVVDGEGCSAQNGFPCELIPNGRLRKRAKRKKI